VEAIHYRRASGHAGADGGSTSDADAQPGNLDRGIRQTSQQAHHAPGLIDSRPAPDGLRSLRPPTVPAAFQLDANFPAAPLEAMQPARSVALNLQSEQHGVANVTFTDRAGQVHVTVRSSDPSLAQSLRSDLGSLAGGLDQHGFEVKLWNPSPGASAEREARVASAELSNHDDARGGQTRHRHSPEDAERRDRRQQEWNENLE
jgi:hypothetical protein